MHNVHAMRLLCLLIASGLLVAPVTSGEELRWSEAGVRSGYINTTSGALRTHEIFFLHPMRTRFDLRDDWHVRAHWEMSAGRLEHRDADGLVFAAGPVLVFRKGDEPWHLEIGSRPSLISEQQFGRKDFGGPFQFTSHFGAGWTNGTIEVGYRFSHMSNARIYSENDGLNQHSLEIGWKF